MTGATITSDHPQEQGQGLRRRGLVRRWPRVGAVAEVAGGYVIRPRLANAHETAFEGDVLTTDTAAIALDLLGGDAWVWQKTLTGLCPGCPPEAAIALLVNGVSVPAERQGDAFCAVARFDPGENEVLAIATMPDGGEERSAPVTYTVRLEPRPRARLAARIKGELVVFDGTGSEPSEYDGVAGQVWSLTPRNDTPAPLDLAEESPGVWSGSPPSRAPSPISSATRSPTISTRGPSTVPRRISGRWWRRRTSAACGC